jgi:hypothetical protein
MSLLTTVTPIEERPPMKNRLPKTMFAFTTLAVLTCGIWLTASAVEPQRFRCCGSQREGTSATSADDKSGQDSQTSSRETDAPTVCPIYKWMNYGSYCSYYAMQKGTPCTPVNHNAACSIPLATSCMDANACVSVERLKTLETDIGKTGYDGVDDGGGKRKAKKDDEVGGNPHAMKLKKVKHIFSFLIKFRHPKTGDDFYARIFVAQVVPKLNEDIKAPVVLARGIEIDRNDIDDNDAVVELDLPNTEPAVKPVSGRGRAYTYHFLGQDVEIIAYKDTAEHGM